jgi:hypothetical protein
LKYSIELWADGLVHCSAARLTPAEKLENLTKYRRAWQNLDWASRTEIEIQMAPRAYELVGGVFAQHDTWPESNLTSIELPSANKTVKIKSVPNIGLESLDFAMDPTQDLVVFLHQDRVGLGHFECRAMSTLKQHPLAAGPTLSFDLAGNHLQRIFLQVADDVVAVLFRSSDGFLRLVLFNWRTGIQLVVS